MTTQVWVVSYHSGCTGGFEWRQTEAEARSIYEGWCAEFPEHDHYFFPYETKIDFSEPTQRQELTDWIDADLDYLCSKAPEKKLGSTGQTAKLFYEVMEVVEEATGECSDHQRDIVKAIFAKFNITRKEGSPA